MNIFYIGSSGSLSLLPFNRLLESEHRIIAVGLFKPLRLENRIIALENDSLLLAAQQQNIPVIDLSENHTRIRGNLSNTTVDVIIMSCYSHRLSDEIIKIAGKGCYNMHPSLLPAYRGPEPVFWQMRESAVTGVSWHKVIQELDAGDIVAQQNVSLGDGISYEEICEQLAKAGAELLIKILSDIKASNLSCSKQQQELASYLPYPQLQDFIIDTSWSAQHAFNFMRATSTFGNAYQCRVNNTVYLLDTAIDYTNDSRPDEIRVQGDTVYIPCDDGILIASFTDKMSV